MAARPIVMICRRRLRLMATLQVMTTAQHMLPSRVLLAATKSRPMPLLLADPQETTKSRPRLLCKVVGPLAVTVSQLRLLSTLLLVSLIFRPTLLMVDPPMVSIRHPALPSLAGLLAVAISQQRLLLLANIPMITMSQPKLLPTMDLLAWLTTSQLRLQSKPPVVPMIYPLPLRMAARPIVMICRRRLRLMATLKVMTTAQHMLPSRVLLAATKSRPMPLLLADPQETTKSRPRLLCKVVGPLSV
jgi:hypothetical protein